MVKPTSAAAPRGGAAKPAGGRDGRGRAFVPFAFVLLLVALMPASAITQTPPATTPGMPDPRQMSGIPLPVSDVAPRTVTVRLIRGALTNPVTGHPVQLEGAATQLTAKTNDAGRAEFTDLEPGTRVQAVAVVSGERLESQPFEVPASAGVRVLLVARDPSAPAGDPGAAPAVQRGAVVLGEQTRFVFELNDDGMAVFNIVQIRNDAQVPVDTSGPIVFELPDGAHGAGVLEGSPPQAVVTGRQVVVDGPFAPGTTLVQFAYSMAYSGDTLTVTQRLPAALERFTVLAQKVGDTHLTSPQMREHREMSAEGQIYIVGQGPGLSAGEPVTFVFTGLPHEPLWPRNIALGLVLVILAAGAVASIRRGTGPAAAVTRRLQLEKRRDRLFDELALLEEQHSAGRVDAQYYAVRRREMVGALERIYAELDEEAAA